MIENSMVVGAADEYENGPGWWLDRKYLERQRREFNCEPEREEIYDDVPAAFKVQAMAETDQ